MARHGLVNEICILSLAVQSLHNVTWSSLPDQFLTSPLNVIQITADLVSGLPVLSHASTVPSTLFFPGMFRYPFKGSWIPTSSTFECNLPWSPLLNILFFLWMSQSIRSFYLYFLDLVMYTHIFSSLKLCLTSLRAEILCSDSLLHLLWYLKCCLKPGACLISGRI